MLLTDYQNRYATLLAPYTGLDVAVIQSMLSIPPQAELGDLAFPVFTIAKEKKIAPQVLALQIVEQVVAAWVSLGFTKIIAVWPYVNIFIDTVAYAQEVLWAPLQRADTQVKKQKILLEYMSGNPNKPLHVGHARNVCIGDTLRRAFEVAGYQIQTSHYGDDSGVNVGYNIVGHLHYGLSLDPGFNAQWEPKKFDHYCGEIYLQMRGKNEDPDFKEKLSQTLHAIENNSDPKIMAFHQDYVKRCTIEQLRSCRRVGASFNMINRETDILHLDLFAEALDMLKSRGHVVFADEGDAKGCWIVDLSSLLLYQKEEKQYAILVKSDGVATYVAKDIAFAMWKLGYLEKQFYFHAFAQQPDGSMVASTTSQSSLAESITFGDYNQAITIIDNRQVPAQTVVKSSLELLGLLWVNAAGEEKHYTPLGYGVVYLTPNTLMKSGFSLSEEEKMLARLPFASRKGWTVTMDAMLDALHARAFEETAKRNAGVDISVLHWTAERIAISAFRFFLTKTDIMKDITFDIDEVLDMEGETGAYVLYTNARIKAVLAKVGMWGSDIHTATPLLTHPLEILLIKKIDELSGVVHDVIAQLAPHLLNRYLITACQLFNSYYNEVNISQSPEAEKLARVALLEVFGRTLEHAMTLVGMQPVERM
jgi:arginyl-tRNA synthetase